MNRKRCPVCGKDNEKVKKTFNREFSEFGNIFPFSSYSVYECNDCGMIYAGDIQESMPLNEYYDKMSRYEGDSFVTSTVINEFYEREGLTISHIKRLHIHLASFQSVLYSVRISGSVIPMQA